MSENINISFIPKKPLARKEAFKRQSVFGISFLVSLTVALVSIGFATSGYFSLKVVEKERVEVMQELDNYIALLKEEKDEDGKTLLENINEEREFVQRTKIAKTLLENHIESSKIFTYLEQTTPTKVVYQNFSYSKVGDVVSISMGGNVGSYGLLASLSQWYKDQSDVIKELTFGGFSPNAGGGVSFSFQAVLYPDLILYIGKTEDDKNETGYIIMDDKEIQDEINIIDEYIDDTGEIENFLPDEQLDT